MEARSASRSCRFTRRDTAPGIHCIGRWVGPRAGLDAVDYRKISCTSRESNPGRPARSLYRLSNRHEDEGRRPPEFGPFRWQSGRPKKLCARCGQEGNIKNLRPFASICMRSSLSVIYNFSFVLTDIHVLS
jgi:hypothetical protein